MKAKKPSASVSRRTRNCACPEIKPAFAERNIPIALSTDENYLPYVKVVVNSIISCTKSGNIDILILHNGIPPQEIDLFLVDFAGVQNVSVRFVNIKKFVESTELSKFDQKRYLSAAACYRLLLPDVLDAYDKLIYLDVDTVVCHDLGELYATDLADNMFGAVIDVVNSSSKPDYAEWARGYGFTEWDGYVNTGVLLLNLAAFRKERLFERLLPIAVDASKYFCDQDALNFICKGRILTLDPRWNVQVGDYCLKQQLAITKSEAYIYHFTGKQKPWCYPEHIMAHHWWRYVGHGGTTLWHRAFGIDGEIISISSAKIAVSVVVPVYNAVSYLFEMLTSLAAQTLKNIEVICIDDGSTDGSLSICKDVAAKDARFKVLCQPNSGAAVARNRGIGVAKGDWLFFADADDFCKHEMLEEMVKAGQCGDHDVVVAGRLIVDGRNNGLVHEQSVPTEYLGIEGKVNCHTDGINVFSGLGFAPWNKLFRREFIIKNDIKFHNIPTCDDAFFVFSSLILAKSISFVGKSYYYYRANLPTSQMGQADKTPTNFLVALKEIRHFIDKQSSRIQEQFYRAAISSCFDHLFAKKTSEGRRQAFSALQKGGLSSLGFPHIDVKTFDFGRVKKVFDLTMAGGSLADVLAEYYLIKCEGLVESNCSIKMESSRKSEEIQKSVAEVKKRDVKISALAAKIAKREERIQALQAQLEERNRAVAKRDEWLAAEKAKVALRDERVAMLQKQLEQKQQAVALRDEWLAAEKAKVAKRDERVSALQTQLEQKQQAVVQRDEWLAEEKAKVAKRDERVSALQAQLGQKQEAVVQRDEWLAAEKAKVAKRDERVSALQAQLEQKQQAVTQRDEWLAAEKAKVTKRDERVLALQAQLEQKQLAVAQRDEWLAAEKAKVSKRDEWLVSEKGKVARRDEWLASEKERAAKNRIRMSALHTQLEQQQKAVSDRDAKLAKCCESLAAEKENLAKCKTIISKQDAQLHMFEATFRKLTQIVENEA